MLANTKACFKHSFLKVNYFILNGKNVVYERPTVKENPYQTEDRSTFGKSLKAILEHHLRLRKRLLFINFRHESNHLDIHVNTVREIRIINTDHGIS